MQSHVSQNEMAFGRLIEKGDNSWNKKQCSNERELEIRPTDKDEDTAFICHTYITA